MVSRVKRCALIYLFIYLFVAILAVVGTAEQEGNLRTRELVNTQEVSELGTSAPCENST